jgi:hypothetical protein
MASVPFPSIFVVEMTDSLAENVKMRFSYFPCHTIRIFESHPLLMMMMQHEFTKQQYDSNLRCTVGTKLSLYQNLVL